MKRALLASLGLSLVAIPMAAFAATATPTTASNLPTPTPTPGTVAKAAQATHLAALKTKGNTEITRRITSLQSSSAALGTSTKLSASDQTALTGQVTTEISGLQQLGAKLAADTTLAQARIDVTSIFSDFRVYALMLPKVRLVTVADNFAAVGDNLNTIANNLHTKIAQAKTNGKDINAAQAAVEDMQAKLDDARPRYTGLADKVIALAPSDYNTNHALLATDRDSLVLARADFAAARADIDTAIKALGGSATASPTTSASPSPTTP